MVVLVDVHNATRQMPEANVKTVIILRGLAGSGKSSVAKLLADLIHNTGTDAETMSWVICSADHWFMRDGEYRLDLSQLGTAHGACQLKFKSAIKDGVELVIVDNTSVMERDFLDYKEEAERAGYRVMCLIVENRHGGVSEHDVPDYVIQRGRQNFQVKL